MNLHFICTGNVFRSRLCESFGRYLLKNHPQFHLTSSGIQAVNAENGPIAWYALRLLKNNNLLDYLSPTWVQTTPALLGSQDLIIFMTPWHLEVCQKRYNYKGTEYQVWDIKDITPDLTDEEIITFSETQFTRIRSQVTVLIDRLISHPTQHE
ncbi:hypothetical protein M1116_04105 [Patescibacteria group bacterium]|nr:hypothetical protein [Patescibacteria group bacterium]